MQVLEDWDLQLDVDTILQGQAADPHAVRRRSPGLVKLAERAVAEGLPLIRPLVIYDQLRVQEVKHDRVSLEGGAYLRSPLLARHLALARSIIVVLCTIGSGLESRASQSMEGDTLYGMTLDTLGSAAVERLANAACRHFENEAAAAGLRASIPLSPGMVDWPLDSGQQQIFSLLDASRIGISRNAYWMMIPRKSLSMVIGVGQEFVTGSTCDYCSMRAVCLYQDHYSGTGS